MRSAVANVSLRQVCFNPGENENDSVRGGHARERLRNVKSFKFAHVDFVSFPGLKNRLIQWCQGLGSGTVFVQQLNKQCGKRIPHFEFVSLLRATLVNGAAESYWMSLSLLFQIEQRLGHKSPHPWLRVSDDIWNSNPRRAGLFFFLSQVQNWTHLLISIVSLWEIVKS